MKISPFTPIPDKNPNPIDEVAHAQWPREGPFQKAVERWFKNNGVVHFDCYHTWDSRRSDEGFPDLLCVCAEAEGRTIYAELKTETGKVSDNQIRWLSALAENPFNDVYLWRPSDIDEITGANGVIQEAIEVAMFIRANGGD